MFGEQLLFWLWVLFGIIVFPIIICWVLFGIAWIKGWNDPNITPIEILERLSKS